MNVELLISHKGNLFAPSVEEGIQWTTDRRGSPGMLKFTVPKAGTETFQEGDPVRLRVDGTNVFYGFVFTKKRNRDKNIDVTAYDQLRYFKNKDTYLYENKTASQLIQMVAGDFGLQTGSIESTGYVIETRIEENKSLWDIVGNALDLELQHKRELFVLFDDFGKLTLKNISSMKLDLLIDAETGENFDYSSSIDQDTYNKIKLTYDNEETGKREIYIAQDGSRINDWGVLQFYEKLQKGENGEAKANALLQLYNKKTRNLKITNAFGDLRCRAGSMPVIQLDLGDMILSNYMVVEKAVHTFKNEQHLMTLTLRGGEFIA